MNKSKKKHRSEPKKKRGRRGNTTTTVGNRSVIWKANSYDMVVDTLTKILPVPPLVCQP